MSELLSWIQALASVGATGAGGIYRASYTPEETQAQDLVAEWMRQAGLQPRIDAAGNLWGRAEGTVAGASAVVTGSHLDSVRNGGNYDGPYGVLAGLMAVRELLRRHGSPALPLEVVAFTGEEGSRFPMGVMGSRGLVAAPDRRLLDEAADEAGITVAEAMRQVGLDPDRLHEARRSDIAAFVEAHIEQGPVLEAAGIPIGVVTSIVGTQRAEVTVLGRADHAGTTPIPLRRDALVGAARMIARLPELALRSGGVITVGRIAASPGSTNVVPGKVVFSIDARHSTEAAKQQLLAEAKALCEEVATESRLGLTWRIPAPGGVAAALSERIQELLRESCREVGLPYLDMPSGAGHDARTLAPHFPSGMLFIPCREGRSHSPEEEATPEAMEAGVAVLSRCLYRLAYQQAPA